MRPRIGYIGHFGAFHTEWGVSNALEKRAFVDRYHYTKLDRDKFTEREYDIVLTTVPHLLPIEFWRAQKGIKIAHYFDLVANWWGRDRAYFPPLRYFDLVLSNDGISNKPYERAGIRRKYFLQAFNPDWHFPIGPMPIERDVAFIGKVYGDRHRLVTSLARSFRFGHFGSDGMCRGTRHAYVCATTKIMIATNANNNVPGYWSNRVYLHLACGGFVLHAYVKGMDKVFEDGKHLVYYASNEDLVQKVRHWLHPDRDEKRRKIAEAGCRLVHDKHTWEVRIGEFWEVLSELGLSPIPTLQAESAASDTTSGGVLKPIVSLA